MSVPEQFYSSKWIKSYKWRVHARVSDRIFYLVLGLLMLFAYPIIEWWSSHL